MLELGEGICGSGLDKAEGQWDIYLLVYRGLFPFVCMLAVGGR